MLKSLNYARIFRLGRTLSAQLYSQCVTILVQLALVPLLLHAWGVTLYGSWLLLSAIPFYLTFSDFGFTFIAKNEMVMAVAAGRRDLALRTFQSIGVMLAIAVPLIMFTAAGLVSAINVPALLSLQSVTAGEARTTLLLLITNVVLYQFFLLICAGIRSENRAATESVWAATSRLGEGAAIAIAALTGGSVVTAAAAMLINRLVFLTAGYVWLRVTTPWIRIGTALATRAELKRLLTPALAYMLMPIGQALMIQGPLLIVGNTLGAAAVVVFSTSRTLGRLGTAATNMLNNSFVTEFSVLAGAGARDGFRRLFRIQMILSLAAAVTYSLVMLVIAQPAMNIFTHGQVHVVEPFFALMILGVAAEMLWSALFTPISAVNRHRAVTFAFLLLAAVGMAACHLLVLTIGLSGAAIVVLLVHGLMVPVCLWLGRPSVISTPSDPVAIEDTIRTEQQSYGAG